METRNSLTLIRNMLPVADLKWKERNLFAVELKEKKIASVLLK